MDRSVKALAMLRRAELSQLYDRRATRRRVKAAARVLIDCCARVQQKRCFGPHHTELAEHAL